MTPLFLMRGYICFIRANILLYILRYWQLRVSQDPSNDSEIIRAIV